MKQKIYPQEVTDEVLSIGQAIKVLFDAQKSNLRTIAKFSGMSVNSVKAVLTGKTANIASYSLVAKALGTNLVDVIQIVGTHPPAPTLAVPAKEEESQDPTDNLQIQ
tara:strand:- start:171157 stop:171477 length:321 start_codon:yes stop_codon:yes gene_type:complete